MPTHSGIYDLKKFSQSQTTFKAGIDMMDNMPKKEEKKHEKSDLTRSKCKNQLFIFLNPKL